MKARKRLALILAAAWLIVGIALTLAGGNRQQAVDYQVKLEAVSLMQSWMDAVKEYKQASGLELTPEDIHKTGLLGTEYTGITTTHGALEAKRTTADPNMAALVVQMFSEAGLHSGDIVGAGFSGSFPALNLAVLAACQAMDLPCVYIASVGASTYGANQPELTFPDMAYRLDMDQGLLEEVLTRIAGYGAEIMRQLDLEQNLQVRMDLYQSAGPIACFVGVGGNLTTTGTGGQDVSWGLIPAGQIRAVSRGSGLIQRYNAQGLPVIHLLNIRELTTEYSLPYDPERLSPPGESAVYYTVAYPRLPGIVCLTGAILTLWAGFIRLRQKEE